LNKDHAIMAALKTSLYLSRLRFRYKILQYVRIQNTRYVFFLDQNEISSYVSRGCSSMYSHADECYFSSLSPDPNQPDLVEYTCTSTCDHNGCNIHLRKEINNKTYSRKPSCLNLNVSGFSVFSEIEVVLIYQISA